MNERINTVIRRLLIIDYKMSIYFVQSQYGQYRSGNKSRSFDRLEGAKAHEYLRVHKGLSFITTVTNDPDGEAVFIEVPDKFRKEVISEKNHRHYVKAAIKGSNIEAVSFQQLFSEKEELTYEDIIASPFANVEDIVIRKIDRETLRLALCTTETVPSLHERVLKNILPKSTPLIYSFGKGLSFMLKYVIITLVLGSFQSRKELV